MTPIARARPPRAKFGLGEEICWQNMKTNAALLFLTAGMIGSVSGAEPKNVAEEERLRESQAAYHVIEAVLVAPDMTFKMPVLAAAFRDTPEWEQRLQHLIDRETWAFAKITFIHFYWKNVSKKDHAFMKRVLEFARARNEEFGLGDVAKMLEAEKGPTSR